MKERWWADQSLSEKYLGRVDADDSPNGVSVSLLGLHSAGSSALKKLAGRTCIELEDVERALDSVGVGKVESAYSRATGATTDDSRRWVGSRKDIADQAALRLVRALMTAKVPMPNALSRAAGVYGVNSETALKFAAKNKAPNMGPALLNDAADRVLISFVSGYDHSPPAHTVSKSTVYEMHERDGRMVQMEIARDTEGKFSSKGGGSSDDDPRPRSRTPDEQYRSSQRDKRVASRDARLKKLRKVKTVRTARNIRSSERMAQMVAESQAADEAEAAYLARRGSDRAALKGQSNIKLSEVDASRERKVAATTSVRIKRDQKSRGKKHTKAKGHGAVKNLTAADVLTYDLGKGAVNDETGKYEPMTASLSDRGRYIAEMTMNESMALSVLAAYRKRMKSGGEESQSGVTEGMVVPLSEQFVQLNSLAMANGLSLNFGKDRALFTLRSTLPAEGLHRGMIQRSLEDIYRGRFKFRVPVLENTTGEPDLSGVLVLEPLVNELTRKFKMGRVFEDALRYATTANVPHTSVADGLASLTGVVSQTKSAYGVYPKGEPFTAFELSKDLALDRDVLDVLINMDGALFEEVEGKPGKYKLSARYSDLKGGLRSATLIAGEPLDGAGEQVINPGRQLLLSEVSALESSKPKAEAVSRLVSGKEAMRAGALRNPS